MSRECQGNVKGMSREDILDKKELMSKQPPPSSNTLRVKGVL